MFEEYTYEKILNDMLDRVPDNLDKRQASIIYNALAPAAVELQNMYINLDVIMNETFADTASRENLIKRASERGLSPYPTTKAIVKGAFTPSNLEIAIGVRFSVENLNYAVTEKITDGQYKLQCEEAGSDANYNLGQLIPINYIEGLQYAEITEILIPGEDEESTEDFRNRYFASFDNQAIRLSVEILPITNEKSVLYQVLAALRFILRGMAGALLKSLLQTLNLASHRAL